MILNMLIHFVLFICIRLFVISAGNDVEVFTEISSTASLPCGSISRHFVNWYNGGNKWILRCSTYDSTVYYTDDFSPDKYNCSAYGNLIIADVTIDDEGNYTCESFIIFDFHYSTAVLIAVVPPSQPVLNIPSFRENIISSIQCMVSSVRPGVGSIVFTVTIGADFTIQSTDSDLSEDIADASKGTVSVTYSPQISLQRTHNGQKAVCKVNWRGNHSLVWEEKTINASFSATDVTLSQSPIGPVNENTVVTFTCVTGEAMPTANVIWSVAGITMSSSYETTVAGLYNAEKRKSVLMITMEKDFNGNSITCFVTDKPSLRHTLTMDVRFLATDVTVTQSPIGPVNENTVVTFMCVTSEAIPTANVIWSVAGITTSSFYETTVAGLYNAKKRKSVLIVTMERDLNKDSITCFVTNKPSLRHTLIMDVRYSPTASISVVRSEIEENSELILFCDIEPGNPVDISGPQWEFQPKYANTNSQALPNQRANNELNITSTVYTDSGYYSCSAWNTVGHDTDGIYIRVLYSPKLLDGENLLNFSSALGAKTTLKLAMRAHPDITQPCQWLLPNKTTIEIKADKVESELFQSFLSIDSVQPTEYGIYTVTTSNGIGSDVNIKLFLVNYGPPEKPRDLFVTSVASEKATISWTAGLGGGSMQTFQVHLFSRLTNKTRILFSPVIDPPLDSPLAMTLVDLIPKTEYSVIVYSMNNYNGGSMTASGELWFTTREEIHTLPTAKETASAKAGAIAGAIIAIIVAGVIIILGIWYFRRQMHKKQQRAMLQAHTYVNTKYETEGDTSNINENEYTESPFYSEVLKAGPDNYEAMSHNQTDNNAPYTDLTTQAASNENPLYSDVTSEEPPNKHKLTLTRFREDDLKVDEEIHKGLYTVTWKGVLSLDESSMPVAIKSMKEDGQEEVQYLLNQMSCLKMVGPHVNIVEILIPELEPECKSTQMVTKWCPNENLRTYLKKQTATSDIFLAKVAVDILEGLVYLEKQTPEILHFCLCAEHILVDETGTCRLTGFDFKQHVMYREMTEEDEGIYGSIEWKAPETIQDCKAHTKMSDIWAFGVLLYEIYTRGAVPYEGQIEEDIAAFVKGGQILSCPEGCSSEIYALMTRCWAYDAQKRPTFATLLTDFRRQTENR